MTTPEPPETLPDRELQGALEAILFVAGEAVEKGALCTALQVSPERLEGALVALSSRYDADLRGIRLLSFGSHVQLTTRPVYAEYVVRLLQPVQKQSLSTAVMETLAVIAYRQPVTKAEVEQIRGVKCDYSLQVLQNRELVQEVGRKETLGRPILYGTTDAFLRHFCISSLDDLPELDFSALTGEKPEEGALLMDTEESVSIDQSPGETGKERKNES